MSNIPSSAISNSLDALQRPANDTLRARRLQAQKNAHHNEDVEELDDTAVDSIRDQAQHNARQEDEEGQPQEKVDIESLKEQADDPAQVTKHPTTPSHLDISA